jgi:regulator of RNase E activity RraA
LDPGGYGFEPCRNRWFEIGEAVALNYVFSDTASYSQRLAVWMKPHPFKPERKMRWEKHQRMKSRLLYPLVTGWLLLISATLTAHAQQGFFTRDDVIKYTPDWHGERFPDGRPKVPDDVLDRMRTVTLEEAWAVLQQNGFMHQYEDGWLSIHEGKVLVGRALTATWMPGRPDVQKLIETDPANAHRIGGMNAWPVDMLQKRDVYVCDHFGLKEGGPSIGDNVGNAIYAKSGNGIVYDGAVRDINGLNELENFVAFVRYYDPSHHYGSLKSGKLLNSTMVNINGPTRIGHVMAMPGDVVLGRDGGVIFIPPQLAEQVVKTSEATHLRDLFGHQRLQEGKYTAGQIDAHWTEPIEQDYRQWLKQNEDHLPFPKSRIEEILKDHE